VDRRDDRVGLRSQEAEQFMLTLDGALFGPRALSSALRMIGAKIGKDAGQRTEVTRPVSHGVGEVADRVKA
jgi:hypothetical protein